ncbi:MAG: ferritin-like domain-containing protein [Chromatiales bacterium]
MGAASTTLHETVDALSADTIDQHRALVSLQEELEAVDWYRQRADAAADDEVRAILLHNMREEIEHACMILEWLRRRNPIFDEQLRTYLFSEGDITEVEETETAPGGTGRHRIRKRGRPPRPPPARGPRHRPCERPGDADRTSECGSAGSPGWCPGRAPWR